MKTLNITENKLFGGHLCTMLEDTHHEKNGPAVPNYALSASYDARLRGSDFHC